MPELTPDERSLVISIPGTLSRLKEALSIYLKHREIYDPNCRWVNTNALSIGKKVCCIDIKGNDIELILPNLNEPTGHTRLVVPLVHLTMNEDQREEEFRLLFPDRFAQIKRDIAIAYNERLDLAKEYVGIIYEILDDKRRDPRVKADVLERLEEQRKEV